MPQTFHAGGQKERIIHKMIKEYKLKNGETRYLVSRYLGIDEATGKEIRPMKRGFKTQREAKNYEARLITSYEESGQLVKKETVKFFKVYEMWLNQYEQTVRESSFKTVSLSANKHILNHFKDYYIDKITLNHCQTFTNDLSKKMKSYKVLINILSRIFDYAVMHKFMTENPTIGIIKPKYIPVNDTKTEKVTFFELDELNQFFEAADEHKEISFIIRYRLLAYTGLRRGELVGLQWGDLDEINKTLSIKRSINKNKHGKWIVGQTKSEKSKRTISIDDETMNMLTHWRMKQKEKISRLGFNTNNPTQHIITDQKNNWLTPMSINNQLERFLKKHKLKLISPHGFRHTHCTLLFKAGYSLNEVQYRLGHEDPTTTLKVYNHLTQKDKVRSANPFNDYINGIKDGINHEKTENKSFESIDIKGL